MSCCGGGCGCSFVAGPGIDLDGTGTPSTPIIISATGATVDCAMVRGCISAAPGLTWDTATGVMAPAVSPAAGNRLALNPDGLFVPEGLTAVATGCGLAGDGSAGAPVAASTAAWPYAACPPDTYAGGVYCDGAGVLRSEPRGRADFIQTHLNATYPATIVPGGFDNPIETRELVIDNPDACREAFVMVEYELDVDFTLPAGSSAASGIDTDTMTLAWNTGSSTMVDQHTHVAKVLRQTIPAGGSRTEQLIVTMGSGTGGATYTRIQTRIRAFIFVL
jgi:hypothetical protein